jgi:hypothetical protein
MRAFALIGLFTTLAAGGSVASENFDAESFISDQCTQCHDSGIYTREDRRVTSLQGLHSQVRMCDANLGTGLFDEDIEAVVGYLNENYYKFAP